MYILMGKSVMQVNHVIIWLNSAALEACGGGIGTTLSQILTHKLSLVTVILSPFIPLMSS